MHASSLLFGISCLSTLVAATPVFVVNTDYVAAATASNTQVLAAIQTAAHGQLSNIPPPATLNNQDSLTNFKLVAFNENSEVAFFEELVFNITNNVAGYQIHDAEFRDTIINNLNIIVAQEKLHQIGANKAILRFTNDSSQLILPCKYQFPVTNLEQSIKLATAFTDMVMGALGDVMSAFGANGDSLLIRGVASSLGQEGEQTGYFRQLLGKNPSELPFLTASTRELAFSILNQQFVVPGSCPNINTIKLPVFKPLVLLTPGDLTNVKTLKFSIPVNSTETIDSFGAGAGELRLVLINQQNAPVVNELKNVKLSGSTITFEADFTKTGDTFNGMTLAVVTQSTGAKCGDAIKFANVVAATKATKWGPALFEIN